MSSEYETLFTGSRDPDPSADLETVRSHFEAASRPYVSSPWPWFCWAAIFPSAALLTRALAGAFGWIGVLLLWSLSILCGGTFEILSIRAHSRGQRSTALASWVFGVQGNLSLVAIVLSLLLLYLSQAWALPGVWLLVLGHSLFMLGSLSFRPLQRAGIVYQVGGVLALLPAFDSLMVMALATLVANGLVGVSLVARRRPA